MVLRRYIFFVMSLSLAVPWYAYGDLQSKTEGLKQTLSLKEAVEVALKNNRSLVRSSLSLRSSEKSVALQSEKFDIKIIPSTSVNYTSSDSEYWSAGVQFSKKTKIGISGSITPRLIKDNDSYRNSVSVALNVPLLQGLGADATLDGVYSSLYALQTAKNTHYKQQDSLAINTITTVYGIINLEKQKEYLRSQLASLKKHITLTELKEKSGLASTMDMYRAELRLKEVQNELTGVEKGYASNIDRLKQLLGVSMTGELSVSAPIDYTPLSVDLDNAVHIALENRVEIEQAKRKCLESKRKMALAKHNILPTVDLHLGYKRYDGTDYGDFDEEDWLFSVNGNSDLLRTEARTAYEQAIIQFKQAEIDMESVREDIIKEVRNQIYQMHKKEQLIADRKEQARQAEGKQALALSKFNHRMADNFDLLEAQTQRQQVETDLLFDTIGYIIDTYTLRSVLGTLVARKGISHEK